MDNSDSSGNKRETQRIPLQMCQSCGAWCVLELRRCLECGASLGRETEEPPPEARTKGEGERGEEPGRGESSGTARPARPRQRPAYVTMLVSLALFGVLSSMAIPALRSVMANGRMTVQANALVASLRLARSTAIKSRSTVRICPVDPVSAAAGRPACGPAPGAWARGWLVYADRNRNGVLDGNPAKCRATTAIGDCIVSVEPPLEGSNTLRATAELTRGVAFLPNGRSAETGALHLCDPARDAAPRTIAVRGTGRVEVLGTRGSAAACD